jgi:membrane protein implicated in regulation of membrane protease activity
MAFYGLGTLPVNHAGLALLGLGLVLVALQPFIASHGILGAGGAVAFVAGSLLLLTVPDGAPYLRISLVAIGAVAIVLVMFAIVVLGAVLKARRKPVATGREALIGTIASVRQEIKPGHAGLVQFQGELWHATAGDVDIHPGGHVVIDSTFAAASRAAASEVSSASEPRSATWPLGSLSNGVDVRLAPRHPSPRFRSLRDEARPRARSGKRPPGEFW